MDRSQARMLALAALVAAAAASRLIPHPPNFTAIGAMALFAGATFPDRRVAVFDPQIAGVEAIGLHGDERLGDEPLFHRERAQRGPLTDAANRASPTRGLPRVTRCAGFQSDAARVASAPPRL